MRTKFKNVANLLFIVLFASCNREGIVENDGLPDNGKIAVATEITVDGIEITTRAASEAGYTTGDGLYDKGDDVTVAAHANDGYELTAFYDKKASGTNLGSSYTFPAQTPRTFKAEFARKYTISVSAVPSDGGTVTGGGKYRNGASCTLTATPNGGYAFDGWYEGSTKVSSNSSYSFTVSSNRTITAKFNAIQDTFSFVVYVDNPDFDKSGSIFVDSSEGIGDDVYEQRNGIEFIAVEGERVQLKVRYISDNVLFSGWYENDVLLSKEMEYAFTPSDTYSQRVIHGKFIKKPIFESTFSVRVETNSDGAYSSGTIEVQINGESTSVNAADGFVKFTLIGQTEALLTVTSYPDNGYFGGWYDTNSGKLISKIEKISIYPDSYSNISARFENR